MKSKLIYFLFFIANILTVKAQEYGDYDISTYYTPDHL